MNLMSPTALDREFRARVARRLVPLGVVVGLRDQIPNLDPYQGVVWHQPWYPSGVVHHIACGMPSFLQQPWVVRRGPHIWILPCFL